MPTVIELKAKAKKKGIKGYYKMNKAELMKAVGVKAKAPKAKASKKMHNFKYLNAKKSLVPKDVVDNDLLTWKEKGILMDKLYEVSSWVKSPKAKAKAKVPKAKAKAKVPKAKAKAKVPKAKAKAKVPKAKAKAPKKMRDFKYLNAKKSLNPKDIEDNDLLTWKEKGLLVDKLYASNYDWSKYD